MKTLGKHILAAYYSDARMNILYCLNDIRRKSGKRPIADDAGIGGAFSTLALSAAEPERQQALIKQLRSRFTFIDVLADPEIKKKKKKGQQRSAQSAENEEPKAPKTPTPQRYEAILTNLFAIIVNLRNTMIHPTDPGKPVEGRAYQYLFDNLVRIYDSSLRTVKRRFSLPDEAVKPLWGCDNKGRAKPVGGFSLSLGEAPSEEDGELSLLDKLHDFGHVLLCSLFLDKSQSAELASHFFQAYPKPWNPDQRSIIRELVAINWSRLPLQRLQSDHTETAVTLNALSELSRCPRPLVECLSPDDLKAFRGSGPTQPGQETADESSTLFVRGYEDRFIPLMMRFMDFDPECRIRFAVDLGQFCYNVRMKPPDQFTDNRTRVRRLSQKILAYGRLADFEEANKPEVWRHLEDNHAVSADEAEAAREEVTYEVRQLKPYIIPRYPQYHYFDDKIGFRLARAGETAAYPVLTTKDVRKPVALELLKDQTKGQDMLPDFWISPSQLLHLGFYLHLHDAQPRHLSLDALLERYRIGMTRLLRSLASGIPDLGRAPHSDERRAALRRWIDGFFDARGEPPFTLSFQDLPHVLVLELLEAKPPALSLEEVIARAAHVLAETQRRQRQLEFLRSNDRKRGKKGFRPIKCGPIGVFLADDFLRFQPVDVSRPDGGKLNSQRYQILQASLAYYAAHIEEPPRIVDLLHDAGMLEGDYTHPFLKDLNLSDNTRQFPGLLTFYEAYLKARERYVKAQHRWLAQGTGAVEVPHWLGLRQPATLQSWLGEQIDSDGNLKQPLPVPRSLFYRPLLTMVGEALNIAPQELEREGTQQFAQGEREARPSITWLIKRYLDGHQRDGSQEMYELPRHYDVFDTHLDTRNKKQAHNPKRLHYLTVSQRRDYAEEVRGVIRDLQDEDLKGKRERYPFSPLLTAE